MNLIVLLIKSLKFITAKHNYTALFSIHNTRISVIKNDSFTKYIFNLSLLSEQLRKNGYEKCHQTEHILTVRITIIMKRIKYMSCGKLKI